jgi:hypothetical protein
MAAPTSKRARRKGYETDNLEQNQLQWLVHSLKNCAVWIAMQFSQFDEAIPLRLYPSRSSVPESVSSTFEHRPGLILLLFVLFLFQEANHRRLMVSITMFLYRSGFIF